MLKSKLFRQYLSLMPIYLAFEYAACYLAASLMGDKDNTWMVAGFLILALYGFRIANWLFKAAMAVPVYYITKKSRIDNIVAKFYKYKLPVTKDMQFCDDILAVFLNLAKQKDIDEDLRQFLYMTVCEVSILKSLNHTLLFMQSMIVIDAALSRYINESNARGAVS